MSTEKKKGGTDMENQKMSEKEAASVFGKAPGRLRSFGIFRVDREDKEGCETLQTGLRIGKFCHTALTGARGEEYCVIFNSACADAVRFSEYLKQKGFFYGAACGDGSWELGSYFAADLGKKYRKKASEISEAFSLFLLNFPDVLKSNKG